MHVWMLFEQVILIVDEKICSVDAKASLSGLILIC